MLRCGEWGAVYIVWNIFASKTPGDRRAGTASALQQPFFNVMPQAKLTDSAERVPQPNPPRVSSTLTSPKEPLATTSGVRPSPGVLQPEMPRRGVLASGGQPLVLRPHMRTSPGVKVVAAVLAVIASFVIIWYAFEAFGGSVNLPNAITNFFRNLPPLVDKKPNTSIAAPEAQPPTLESLASYETTIGWREKYFGKPDCEFCADDSDSDSDGLSNREEFQGQTDPTKSDTDDDGLADGDEIHVFKCSGTNKYSAGNQLYTDGDTLRGGWDCVPGQDGDVKLSDVRLQEIKTRAAEFGFHSPTITTLGASLVQYSPEPLQSSAPAVLPAGVDLSAQAQLDRDVQRLNTIKKIGIALLAYKEQLKAFPEAASFAEMAVQIKPFLGVATNTQDPINSPPFLYEYIAVPATGTFALTYYSETQKQVIRHTAEDAAMDLLEEGAQMRDAQRMEDLDKIRSALLIYSAAAASSTEGFSFPSRAEYKQKIAPQYIQTVPQDPKGGRDYDYQVGGDGGSFTLKAVLEKPVVGTTGYMCNQEECRNY